MIGKLKGVHIHRNVWHVLPYIAIILNQSIVIKNPTSKKLTELKAHKIKKNKNKTELKIRKKTPPKNKYEKQKNIKKTHPKTNNSKIYVIYSNDSTQTI